MYKFAQIYEFFGCDKLTVQFQQKQTIFIMFFFFFIKFYRLVLRFDNYYINNDALFSWEIKIYDLIVLIPVRNERLITIFKHEES